MNRCRSTRAAWACFPADHIKSASDLGIPLIAVGLYYSQGYFKQRLNTAGWQEEDYLDLDHRILPMKPALDPEGQPIQVKIETRTGTIFARVWQLAVGRNKLLLLDSNVEGNAPEDRELTARLYGGDTRVRIRQELLLGIGGVRALHAAGINPGVVHLNEGHSAFAALELMRQRMQQEGLPAEEAMRRVSSQVVFTTHTPVPAGHDRFSPHLMEEHLGPLRESLGMGHDQFMAVGRVDPYNPNEDYCMTVLALKLSTAGQCRGFAAWASFARHVDKSVAWAAGRRGADWPHHQRRTCALVVGPANASGLRPPLRARLAREMRQFRILGRH